MLLFSYINRAQPVLYILIAFILVLVSTKADIEWKWAHLYFNYEHGFLKRGLVGELFRFFSLPLDLESFKIFSILLLCTLIASFYNAAYQLHPATRWGFVLLFLFSPALLRNYILDWGRYDQIAIIFILSLIAFSNRHLPTRILIILSPLLLLAHEAFIFWAFPVITSITIYKMPKLLWYLIPSSIAVCIAILLWGNLSIAPFEYYEGLRVWAEPHFIHWAVILSVTNDTGTVIKQYAPYFIENFSSKKGISSILWVLLICAPIALIRSRILMTLSLLGILSSSVLFALAADHWRWISLIATHSMLSLLFAAKENQLRYEIYIALYFVALGLIGIFFDPVGIFPKIFLNVNLTPDF